jgi:hypothetical protein
MSTGWRSRTLYRSNSQGAYDSFRDLFRCSGRFPLRQRTLHLLAQQAISCELHESFGQHLHRGFGLLYQTGRARCLKSLRIKKLVVFRRRGKGD